MKKNIIYLVVILNTINLFGQKTGTFTDPRDGKIYKIVTIGTQIILAENLAFKPDSGNYWSYNNDQSNIAKYGYLYDWNIAKKVCPIGWHIPTDNEWTTLITYLGGDSVAGGKLKEIGTVHWESPNTEATNTSGFTALPGGIRNGFGVYSSMGRFGLWWSATEYEITDVWDRLLGYNKSNIERHDIGKLVGLSVRCMKD
jgi:uncharacterized protein (TIGR02145 family)